MNTQKRLIREAVYKLQQIVFLIGVPPFVRFLRRDNTTWLIARQAFCKMSVTIITQFWLTLHPPFTHFRTRSVLHYVWQIGSADLIKMCACNPISASPNAGKSFPLFICAISCVLFFACYRFLKTVTKYYFLTVVCSLLFLKSKNSHRILL